MPLEARIPAKGYPGTLTSRSLSLVLHWANPNLSSSPDLYWPVSEEAPVSMLVFAFPEQAENQGRHPHLFRVLLHLTSPAESQAHGGWRGRY